ncbi:MerR family transcriptional regulator [Hamadaea tsunoensis]|uniref:MerR family transcriptional regulator n=1 Tax=Hamadaea tsunoensis TaxID=53368 RepID=UPI00040E6220|nr:MerR family transcriptional regulator [Hamadaea tsunoensis]
MRIGELSRRAGASVRALRYYEQEGLLRPARAGNGYRDYSDGAVDVVRQIRGLIDFGLPVRMIRDILPFLDGPADLLPDKPCTWLLDEAARQRDLLDRRIGLLTRNRDALDAYLAAAAAAGEV